MSRANFDDIGISLDLGDWAYQFLDELDMWAARKNPAEPFPNLKISVTPETIEDIHGLADVLIDQIKEELPPEAKFSNIQKFKIGDLKALSVDISGRVHEGQNILIIMKIISLATKMVTLSFTLVEETLPKYKNEFQKITNSLKEI